MPQRREHDSPLIVTPPGAVARLERLQRQANGKAGEFYDERWLHASMRQFVSEIGGFCGRIWRFLWPNPGRNRLECQNDTVRQWRARNAHPVA
jgi:hypothetical protein